MAESRPPLAGLSDPALEQALVDLGRHLAYPALPDIANLVRARLETGPAPRWALVSRAPLPAPGRQGFRASPVAPRGTRVLGTTPRPSVAQRDSSRSLGMTRWQRLALAAACLLLAIVAGLVLFPEARTAIAERLGLRGVVMRWVDAVPTPEPSPLGAELTLGRQRTLEEAQAAVDFPLRLPRADGFETPGEIYLLGQGENAMVSLVYPARPGLPASEFSGVGALLTQFEGETERGFIEKGLAGKTIDPETVLEYVTVGDNRGYWITGAPHGFFLVCGDGAGECREERYRLAGNVLLWEQDGVTMRLESALPRDAALAIAESVRATE